ncbi:ADP-ribosylhydrolase ARH3-like isoform X2 [Oratosquilla oratoria]|uniref:ADP-ribosylhydrolase ARH3-like isoform X2 n=1 Tax=Oratosquilla oratoria TaxID=337810 RepID=UPI003F7688EE
MSKDRFQGCLVGAVVGDCLGRPFEMLRPTDERLSEYFFSFQEPNLRLPYKPYTDDTAMTRCVAQSLIDKKGFNARDMAVKFVKEYYTNSKRGYGSYIPIVFFKLKETHFTDLYGPAKRLVDGKGSYGNGGAMRIAPVALFCRDMDKEEMLRIAKEETLLTHSNRRGYNGAILQCLAVHIALHTLEGTLERRKFLDQLIMEMESVETCGKEELDDDEDELEYVKRLRKVDELLDRGTAVRVLEVEDILGTAMVAHLSVPTAIYAFLRVLESTEGEGNKFQETIKYAISLGGDTDTIASMAGSIAGAYYGLEMIPLHLQEQCEGINHAITQATKLHKMCEGQNKMMQKGKGI